MSEENGNGATFRRWIDKAFLGALALVITLVAFVFINLSDRVARLEAAQQEVQNKTPVLEERIRYCAAGIDDLKIEVRKLLERK